jgi:hypothetical protein
LTIPAESSSFLLPVIRRKRSSEFGQLSLLLPVLLPVLLPMLLPVLLSLSNWELPPDGSYPSTSIFSCFW